jgi:transcriptional accessory protein Tex/SPT6
MRRTRATIAEEQGLEPPPAAALLFNQQSTTDPQTEAAKYVSAEKDVADVNDALADAPDVTSGTQPHCDCSIGRPPMRREPDANGYCFR